MAIFSLNKISLLAPKIQDCIGSPFHSLTLYGFLTTSGQQAVAEGTGHRNGPSISLKMVYSDPDSAIPRSGEVQ
jgi:hypothetical protein